MRIGDIKSRIRLGLSYLTARNSGNLVSIDNEVLDYFSGLFTISALCRFTIHNIIYTLLSDLNLMICSLLDINLNKNSF